MREERLARCSLKTSRQPCSLFHTRGPRSRVLGGDFSVYIELDYVTMSHIFIKKLRFSLERNGEYQLYKSYKGTSHHAWLTLTIFSPFLNCYKHNLLLIK